MQLQQQQNQPNTAALPRTDFAVAAFIALLLFGVYMLTFDGTMHSTDGLSMLAVAENWVKHGNFDTRQLEDWENVFLGSDGLPYTNFAVGPTLFFAPLVALALAVPNIGLVPTVLLLMPLSTALSGLFLYLSARRLGYAPTVSIATVLLGGLGTMTWLRTRDLVADPLMLLSFAASFYYALAYRQQQKLSQAGLMGLALSVTVLHKVVNITAVPFFFAYAFLPAQTLPKIRERGLSLVRRLDWPAIATATLAWATCLLVIGVYNVLRFGNPLDTGYPNLFTTPFWIGFTGFLISPYKSIFLYIPLFILIPFTLKRTWRRHPLELLLIAALLISQMLIFGAWFDWGGGRNWGPRFLVPLNGLLMLLLLPLIDRAFQQHYRRERVVLLAFAAVSIGLQIVGISARDNAYLDAANYWTPPPNYSYLGELSLSQPAQWPIWGHMLQFDLFDIPLIWRWQWQGQTHFDPLSLAAALLIVALGGIGLIIAARRRISLLWAAGAWLLALACVALMITRSFDDPRSLKRADEAAQLWPTYSQLVKQLPALVSPADAVIFTNRRFEFYLFDQDKSAAQRYVIAKHTQPIILQTVPQLLIPAEKPQRIWLVTDDQNNRQLAYAVELWLLEQGVPTETQRFGEQVQLTAFDIAPSAALPALLPEPVLHGLVNPRRTKFNGIAGLLGWRWPALPETALPQLSPGQNYPFELAWIFDGKAADDHFFVRLRDSGGQIALTQPLQPRPDVSPVPGDLRFDAAIISVPADLPAGTYQLELGFTIPIVADGELIFDLPPELTQVQVIGKNVKN